MTKRKILLSTERAGQHVDSIQGRRKAGGEGGKAPLWGEIVYIFKVEIRTIRERFCKIPFKTPPPPQHEKCMSTHYNNINVQLICSYSIIPICIETIIYILSLYEIEIIAVRKGLEQSRSEEYTIFTKI